MDNKDLLKQPFFLVNLAIVMFLVVVTVIFWVTDLDLVTAGYYYDAPADHWTGHDNPLYQFFYSPGDVIFSAVYFVVGFPLLLFSFVNRPKFQKARMYRQHAWFLILVLAFGAGLVVNVIVKNLFAHPRPREIIGDSASYFPPFAINSAWWGESNTSFPCGHCAPAWGLVVFFFMFRYAPKLWQKVLKWGVGVAGTLVFGTIMTLTRLSMGGHFLSDGIWSGAFMYLTALGLYYALRLPAKQEALREWDAQAHPPVPWEPKDKRLTALIVAFSVVLGFALVYFVLL